MGKLMEWFEERRTEGLGALLSLAVVAAGLGILGYLGWRALGGGGSRSFNRRDLSALALVDADGATHRVADLRGKVVVLDFWATWCPPCRRSLPELAALQARQGDDYAVVPVSLDRGGFQDVTPFFQQNPQLQLSAMVPAEPAALDKQVGRIEGIPTTLILDREGRVAKALVGYAPGRLEQELRTALRP
jgi:thiol-disulfide isomerase/thioredoxin